LNSNAFLLETPEFKHYEGLASLLADDLLINMYIMIMSVTGLQP